MIPIVDLSVPLAVHDQAIKNIFINILECKAAEQHEAETILFALFGMKLFYFYH